MKTDEAIDTLMRIDHTQDKGLYNAIATAITALREQQKQPNEPLTMEELLTMNTGEIIDYNDRHGYELCTTQKSNSELSEKERLKQRVCNQRKEIAALHKQLADAYASIELASDACKTIEANYKSQFAEKEIELQAMRNAANQYKRDFTCATKELNAALDDLSGFCWACAHGKPAKIRTGGLATCDYMREQGTLARGGRCKCGYWQWRGPQKEDNENDD